MVSATRRGVVGADKSATKPDTNGVAMSGKRKAETATAKKSEGQQAKRRKRDSLEATETISDANEQSQPTTGAPSAQSKHMRFDSEEPELPEETQPEKVSEVPDQREDDDDSDDDAPEAIDNSAQLLKIKEHAKKLEKARQMYVLSRLFQPSVANIRLQRGHCEKRETAETRRAPKAAGQIDHKDQRNQRTSGRHTFREHDHSPRLNHPRCATPRPSRLAPGRNLECGTCQSAPYAPG
jgi:hypothetical protein